MAAVANARFDTIRCSIEDIKEIYLLSIPGCQEVIFEFTSQKTMQAVAKVFKNGFITSGVQFKLVPKAEAMFKEIKFCCAFAIVSSSENRSPYMGDVLDSFVKAVGEKISPQQKAVEIVVKAFLPREH